MKTEKSKSLSKLLGDFTYKGGYEISRVFDDFLQYIIWLHTIPEFGKPIEGWKYNPEENKQFFGMYQTLILELQEHLKHHQWFDIFGHIYEDLIAGKGRRDNCGQFFTPPSLCDLMVEISTPRDEVIVGKNISDPTCGSGRNLLAFNAKHLGNYLVGEDIDRTCAMMTVCNFILHGVKGEVIWHNTLIDDSYYGGWRTNEDLNNPFKKYVGLPHCRPITYEESILKCQNDALLKSVTDKRVREKLIASLNKHVASLRDIMKSELSKKEKKHQARLFAIKIRNIKKLIDGCE